MSDKSYRCIIFSAWYTVVVYVLLGEKDMDVLISIRPEYVDRIISGEKTYEFRKKIFKEPISKVYIYSSSPQKKIIGFFEWAGFLTGRPEEVWERTKAYAGIRESDYQRYFAARDQAYAIRIDKLHVFEEYVDPWIQQGFYPPQSFSYFREKDRRLYEELCRLV